MSTTRREFQILADATVVLPLTVPGGQTIVGGGIQALNAGASRVAVQVEIQAAAGNAGSVLVGDSAARHIVLAAGQVLSLLVRVDVASIMVDVPTGNTARILWMAVV